ncbi:hypothetical protein F3Y22_tig00111331pilonHSYRG00115 [Hibiscus syriacus]|uniref:Uncharacterized protein n=1 Tax=Hibiscus syriacus TaxID=106335 RepID=A0A6A2YPP4_HIBSY|nr:hypothetical protein F3Y22_tig00111331pilonHSYRG00115 [Hibiscus syriacus]
MQHVDSDNYSSDYEVIFQDDFTDIDRYSEAEASIAIERCVPDSSITELIDFICVAQMAKAGDAILPVEDMKLLLWVGRNNVVPLEPDEVEMLLGFPKNHTLGGSARDMFPGDAQELNGDRLEQLMIRLVKFDIVVGGIQCNNLTGRNKHHRD